MRGAFGEELRRRAGREQLVLVERVDDAIGVERRELDAPHGVRELGAIHHALDATVERHALRMHWTRENGGGEQREGERPRKAHVIIRGEVSGGRCGADAFAGMTFAD